MLNLIQLAGEDKLPGLLGRLNAARRRIHYARQVLKRLDGVYPRDCNICGYSGLFRASGLPPRFDAQCPSCRSLERHRHQYLWVKPNEGQLRDKRILHFAPEPVMREIYSALASSYLSADIAGHADRVLNIEAIDMPDESWDVVVANHVLEHVDDRKALAEIRRILAPGGLAILSVPLALGFEHTYENPTVTSRADRDLHFGQWDHVRVYGADAAARIAAAGLAVETFSATEPHVHLHATTRGCREFIARKL
jgi:SAM-dependent methyltransferase